MQKGRGRLRRRNEVGLPGAFGVSNPLKSSIIADDRSSILLSRRLVLGDHSNVWVLVRWEFTGRSGPIQIHQVQTYLVKYR